MIVFEEHSKVGIGVFKVSKGLEEAGKKKPYSTMLSSQAPPL